VRLEEIARAKALDCNTIEIWFADEARIKPATRRSADHWRKRSDLRPRTRECRSTRPDATAPMPAATVTGRSTPHKYNQVGRKRLQASKLRLQLGGFPDIRESIPSKPKWTRRRTFRRIVTRSKPSKPKSRQDVFANQYKHRCSPITSDSDICRTSDSSGNQTSSHCMACQIGIYDWPFYDWPFGCSRVLNIIRLNIIAVAD
jgi:hypothetical protein